MEYLKKLYLESIGIDYISGGTSGATETAFKQEGDPALGFETLVQLRDEIGDCRRCQLCQDRTNIVFGVGDPEADLVFVGEAPGRDEDIQGQPFVGKAGQLLDRIISAMGLTREEVYICNVVKCRPPGNRDPNPDEIEKCEPFLKEQLRIIRPRVICTLGSFASQTLLNSEVRISRLRGKFSKYNGVPLMPTFHPSFLLRNPDAKRDVWEDIKMVMELLDLPLPGNENS